MAPASFLVSLALAHAIYAASISTSTPSPPLQWINLSSLLSGSSPPPPLKDVSIGYNEGTRTLLIFGGESQSGVPQSQTYLLNLDALTWALPNPPTGIGGTPPARSSAISGEDFAASYRTGHVVAGGKGTTAFLTDIWEFDYNNQFWAEVNVSGGPSVIAAGGGIDSVNEAFVLNGSLPTNVLYTFGSSSSPVSLGDAWELQITGAQSSNIVSGLSATWVQRTVTGTFPSVSGQGGTVNKQKLISFGGCSGTASPNVSCALQTATVVDVVGGSSLTLQPCVAPRLDAAVVSNRNGFQSGFANQAFVTLGTFDSSLWDDGGGSTKGEVDILDFSAATWTRVLPAGDPGTSGTPTFPSPRSGAAALSYPSGLVGTSRAAYSDTIFFGGQDASGTYLSEVWILRAYNGSTTPSSPKWSGFGSGTLTTGVNANGAGVSMQFMTSCATAKTNNTTSSSSSTSGTPSPTSGSPSPGSSSASPQTSFHPYDTATSHKVLAPVSIALLLPAIILYRLSQPAVHSPQTAPHGPLGLQIFAGATSLVAFGTGLAGLVLSFTTVFATPQSASLAKRSESSIILQTAHGQAGLALFLLLYVLLPIIYVAYVTTTRSRAKAEPLDSDELTSKRDLGAMSADPAEKQQLSSSPDGGHHDDRSAATTPAPDVQTSPRRRHRSLTGSSLMTSFRPTVERRSSESIAASESALSGPSSSTAPQSFEVLNRPRRRQLSTTEGPSESSHRAAHNKPPRRSLSEISWLERRRSVHAVNEIDYALMQLHHQRGPPTPGTADLSTRALMNVDDGHMDASIPIMPPGSLVLFHFLLHALVLAIAAFALVALWERAPRWAFIVFLIYTVAFYALLFGLAWRGYPRESMLTVLLARLRGEHAGLAYALPPATPSPSRPLSPADPNHRGPYLHQPLYHAAGEDEFARSPVPVVTDEADSDEDEDTRQRRIEEEMQRRDVSIVTVPKRKLWITNPS